MVCGMPEKNFDEWNRLKKTLNCKLVSKFAHAREIWWCSLGLNVGAETDGKNNSFERPVIIMKKYNRESFLILPLTSKEKNDRFHYRIETRGKVEWVKLTQVRLISCKRLLRQTDTVSEEVFQKLKNVWIDSL
jgi:mRNA interferase MazF